MHKPSDCLLDFLTLETVVEKRKSISENNSIPSGDLLLFEKDCRPNRLSAKEMERFRSERILPPAISAWGELSELLLCMCLDDSTKKENPSSGFSNFIN